MLSKIQWKPFWLATQLYPQNDWAGGTFVWTMAYLHSPDSTVDLGGIAPTSTPILSCLTWEKLRVIMDWAASNNHNLTIFLSEKGKKLSPILLSRKDKKDNQFPNEVMYFYMIMFKIRDVLQIGSTTFFLAAATSSGVCLLLGKEKKARKDREENRVYTIFLLLKITKIKLTDSFPKHLVRGEEFCGRISLPTLATCQPVPTFYQIFPILTDLQHIWIKWKHSLQRRVSSLVETTNLQIFSFVLTE